METHSPVIFDTESNEITKARSMKPCCWWRKFQALSFMYLLRKLSTIDPLTGKHALILRLNAHTARPNSSCRNGHERS